MFFPGAGALGLLWLIAAYAIIFEVMLVMLGFRLRGHRSRLQPQKQEHIPFIKAALAAEPSK